MTGSNLRLNVILRFIRFGIVPFNHVIVLHHFLVEVVFPFLLAFSIVRLLDRSFPSLLNLDTFLLYLVSGLPRKVVLQNAVIGAVPQYNLNSSHINTLKKRCSSSLVQYFDGECSSSSVSGVLLLESLNFLSFMQSTRWKRVG